ncbi:MAG: ABC transporter permease [Bacillota bacterium]
MEPITKTFTQSYFRSLFLPLPNANSRQGSFFPNRPAVLGLWLLAVVIIIVFLGPMVSNQMPDQVDLSRTNQAPSQEYWFGTDQLGRDLFTRVCYGARLSLFVALSTAVIVSFIGVVYGGFAGYMGGWTDEVLMRVLEIIASVPFLIYAILLMTVLGPGVNSLLVALAAVYWMPMARVVRGQFINLKEEGFVIAARVLGLSRWRIILGHIVPNALGVIIVYGTLVIPEAIFAEALLSYIGLGVSSPQSSLGSLVGDGLGSIRLYPWQLFFPALFIILLVLSLNLIGEGLREYCDPRFFRQGGNGE